MTDHESEKLRRALPGWYRQMHAQGAYDGHAFRGYLGELLDFLGGVPQAGEMRWLDYGCGPHGGLAAIWPQRATGYDPYVPGRDADPWGGRYDGVFSADVLEHMPVSQVTEFLDRTLEAAPRVLFLAVATRSSTKRLPNGLSVHLTVAPPAWWLGLLQAKLNGHYECKLARHDLVGEVATFGFVRRPRAVGTPEGPPCES